MNEPLTASSYFRVRILVLSNIFDTTKVNTELRTAHNTTYFLRLSKVFFCKKHHDCKEFVVILPNQE